MWHVRHIRIFYTVDQMAVKLVLNLESSPAKADLPHSRGEKGLEEEVRRCLTSHSGRRRRQTDQTRPGLSTELPGFVPPQRNEAHIWFSCNKAQGEKIQVSLQTITNIWLKLQILMSTNIFCKDESRVLKLVLQKTGFTLYV